jgi:hypothetical protein
MRSICHVQSIKKMFVESIPLMGGSIHPGSPDKREKKDPGGREKREKKKKTN